MIEAPRMQAVDRKSGESLSMRKWLIGLLLVSLAGPACADDWTGTPTFLVEAFVVIPSAALLLAINIAWTVCRRIGWWSAGILTTLSALAPAFGLRVWIRDLGQGDGRHFATSERALHVGLLFNGPAFAIPLLPLAISGIRAWMASRRAFGGPTLADLVASEQPGSVHATHGKRIRGRKIGIGLVLAGATAALVAGCIAFHLLPFRNGIGPLWLFYGLAVFAIPLAIVGSAFSMRARQVDALYG